MTIPLPSHRPPNRFYRGGAGLARFRGISIDASHEPEDWVGSVTTVFGDDEVGLTRLPDGRTLRDAIAADPGAWLGERHVARWGSDTQLLVKLLDAGQRLPVHAHPDDEFAARHLGHAHGKAEAWYILEGGEVHLGLRAPVTPARLSEAVREQDTRGILDMLHRVAVAPGDVVWVPPGELHAIGEGVVLVELQQPEDLSILLEWAGFAIDGARDGHLGLGFDTALGAVNLVPRNASELSALVRRAPETGSVLPRESERYFRLHRHAVKGPSTGEAGFAIAVVTDGEVIVNGTTFPRGATVLIAHRAGPLRLDGTGEVLVARPPSP